MPKNVQTNHATALLFLAPHKPRGPDFGKVGIAWVGLVWTV